MIAIWLYSIFASLLVCVIALVGAFALFVKQEKLKNSIQFLVSLAVGVLLGDAFLHLIPDAYFRIGDLQQVLLFTIGGIILFFFLEKVVRWRHSHEIYPITNANTKDQPTPMAKMNLIGDAIHNFVDGTLIAGSFMVDIKLGITTFIAIVIHEIPQELGDIGTLIHGGYTPKKAVWYNFICSLTCPLGAICVLLLGSVMDVPVAYLLPIAAGGFIYIASSDLIPVLHTTSVFSKPIVQGVAICFGVASMLFINVLENAIK